MNEANWRLQFGLQAYFKSAYAFLKWEGEKLELNRLGMKQEKTLHCLSYISICVSVAFREKHLLPYRRELLAIPSLFALCLGIFKYSTSNNSRIKILCFIWVVIIVANIIWLCILSQIFKRLLPLALEGLKIK